MLQQTYIDRLITTALDEDIHYIDVTTDNLLDDSHTSEAYYLAKDSGVLCGIDIAKRVFELWAAISPWTSVSMTASRSRRAISSQP